MPQRIWPPPGVWGGLAAQHGAYMGHVSHMGRELGEGMVADFPCLHKAEGGFDW